MYCLPRHSEEFLAAAILSPHRLFSRHTGNKWAWFHSLSVKPVERSGYDWSLSRRGTAARRNATPSPGSLAGNWDFYFCVLMYLFLVPRSRVLCSERSWDKQPSLSTSEKPVSWDQLTCMPAIKTNGGIRCHAYQYWRASNKVLLKQGS